MLLLSLFMMIFLVVSLVEKTFLTYLYPEIVPSQHPAGPEETEKFPFCVHRRCHSTYISMAVYHPTWALEQQTDNLVSRINPAQNRIFLSVQEDQRKRREQIFDQGSKTIACLETRVVAGSLAVTLLVRLSGVALAEHGDEGAWGICLAVTARAKRAPAILQGHVLTYEQPPPRTSTHPPRKQQLHWLAAVAADHYFRGKSRHHDKPGASEAASLVWSDLPVGGPNVQLFLLHSFLLRKLPPPLLLVRFFIARLTPRRGGCQHPMMHFGKLSMRETVPTASFPAPPAAK